MSDLREMQKAEAIKRMKALHMLSQPIRGFEKEEKLNLSERIGILYWLEDDEKKMVKDFEEKWGFLVYHVIKSYTTLGLMYSLMYVSDNEEDWELDAEDIQDGQAVCYVINKDMPDCSEFGVIGIKPMTGGVVRTW